MSFLLYLIVLRCVFCKYYDDSCGIMIYKYGDDNPNKNNFYYNYFGDVSVNLGDYVQSIVSKQFCRRKKVEYVDRDYILHYKGPPVKMIMNAWWYLQNTTFYPSEYITPLYISFHIVNQNIDLKEHLLYLKEHEPIGCRDVSTMNFLNLIGIKAYFSGCLTLTLGLSYKNYADRINDTILCIVNCLNCKTGNVIWDYLMNIVLIYFNFTKVIYLSKHYRHYSTHYERFEQAERFLKIYEKSTLVITNNFHTLLPCISMNTPVIFAPDTYLDIRYSGYMKLINYIYITNEDNKIYLKYNISMNKENKKKKVYNPDNMKRYSSLLIRKVNEFMNEDD